MVLPVPRADQSKLVNLKKKSKIGVTLTRILYPSKLKKELAYAFHLRWSLDHPVVNSKVSSGPSVDLSVCLSYKLVACSTRPGRQEIRTRGGEDPVNGGGGGGGEGRSDSGMGVD